MLKHWAALLALTLCAAVPKAALGQGKIKGALPNPFNPVTTVTFGVGDDPCRDKSKQHVVTLQIVNQLGQPLVYPILQGSSGGNVGKQINGLRLTCGEYTAFFDGKDPRTRKDIPSGVYWALLTIDGKLIAKLPMTVIK